MPVIIIICLPLPWTVHSGQGSNVLILTIKPLSILTWEDGCLIIAPKEVVHQDGTERALNTQFAVHLSHRPPPLPGEPE